MKQILIKLFLLIILITTMACGFKVVDKTQLNNFKISEIKSTGDKRINYKIKNYLLINSLETSQNIISLNINVNKAKEIKEKNLKNEVTKYEININVSVKIDFENQRDNHSITISRKGDFLVGTSYVATLNNEKKLTENLTENIFKIILKEIVYQTNDL